MTTATLKKLDDGIAKFQSTSQKDILQRLSRDGQKPEAIIVTCADSRVAPETLFGADVGQLFVIRVAGNVVGSNELASIEYAALTLEVPVCIVVGHSKCGAVAASLDWHTEKKELPTPSLQALVQDIEPSVAKAVAGSDKDVLGSAIAENVRRVVGEISSKSPSLTDKVNSKQFEIKGAVVDMDTATLQWI